MNGGQGAGCVGWETLAGWAHILLPSTQVFFFFLYEEKHQITKLEERDRERRENKREGEGKCIMGWGQGSKKEKKKILFPCIKEDRRA